MGLKNSREMLIGVVCALLVLGLSYTAPMLGLDRIAYDWGIRLALCGANGIPSFETLPKKEYLLSGPLYSPCGKYSE